MIHDIGLWRIGGRGMSIRLRVALPYLLLTVVVSIIGVYVVTRLVTGTMRERLTNQLLEAGRVVSDYFVRQEQRHVLEARRIAYTEGVAEAVRNRNEPAVLELTRPIFGEGGIDNLILISPQGGEVVHFIMGAAGEVRQVEQDTGAALSPIAAPFLAERNPGASPVRALGRNSIDHEVYYYTALPISLNNQFYGVVMVGTSLRKLLPELKSVALADVVVYGNDGQAVAATLGSGRAEILDRLSISGDVYREVIFSENYVAGDNFLLDGRYYTLARAPLQVGSDRIGVFGVVLPLEFVIQSGEDSRTTYVLLFTLVMLVVIGIGFVVSRTIIVPLYSLVNTSLAITRGDLDRRTGITAKDEIGTLATTFDEMTARLQERTVELERANEILQRIDKTKTNFIQISAHELRTPLTLIMGYSQMLEEDAKNDPEMLKLAQGILEGSERMADVVESMLDVSRIDSDALFLKRTNLELSPLIRKVWKGFANALEERKIEFDTDGLEKLPPISADSDMLQKVFYHLIMNAIKYTPDGGQVRVVGAYLNGVEPPQVEIAVCDTGIGVDPAMKTLIFEKFHQTGEVLVHSSGKTKFKGGGPGLGLAIARGIVEAHGGWIRVESPGYNEETFPGSKFIVSLPVQKDAAGGA
jgi:signal transduction histidine kinase